MGRTVVGDETQLQAQVDAIAQSGQLAQVGLLVGKLGRGGSRDLVLALVPTPMNEDDELQTLGISDSKRSDSAAMQFSAEWVGEHSRQVSRMLLGGMSVIGVYAFCSEGIYKSSMAALWQAVMTVAGFASSINVGVGEAPEFLLLHISSSPRRFSCRSCAKGSTFSTAALHPCEWKLGKLLSNLQEFSCTYNVDMSYPVKIDTGAANNCLRENLFSAIAYEGERLLGSRAVIDGSLVEPEKLLGSGSTLHSVELLLPIDGGAQVQSTGGETKIVGKIVFKGKIHSRAYGIVREPISRAIDGLKEDIVASLRSRLELLVDEAEQAANDARYDNADSTHELTPDTVLMRHLSSDIPEHSLVMPQRVFVPWIDGAMISDYLLPEENVQDVQEHFKDLFGMERKLEPSDVIDPETIGVVSMKVTLPPQVRQKNADGNLSESSDVVQPKAVVSNSRSTVHFMYAGAALVLLIAMLLSIFFLSL